MEPVCPASGWTGVFRAPQAWYEGHSEFIGVAAAAGNQEILQWLPAPGGRCAPEPNRSTETWVPAAYCVGRGLCSQEG